MTISTIPCTLRNGRVRAKARAIAKLDKIIMVLVEYRAFLLSRRVTAKGAK